MSAPSTEDVSSAISSSSAFSSSSKQDNLNSSITQASSENKNKPVIDNTLRRNLGIVDSPPVKEKNQGKAESELAEILKNTDRTSSKLPDQRPTAVEEDSVDTMAPNVPLGDEKKEASLDGAAPWIPEEVTFNAPEEPCVSTKAANSSKPCKDGPRVTQRGPENVPVKDVTTDGDKSKDLLGTGKLSSQASVKKAPSIPNSKSPDQRKEWPQLTTTVKSAKKASEKKTPAKDLLRTPALSFSKNNLSDKSKLSVNIPEKSDPESVASKTSEVAIPIGLQQKSSLSSEVRPVIATNCFSRLSSNTAEHNGEIFTGEGLKTYSKRSTANKRKSISKESSEGDSSSVSKALKMDNKKSTEDDHVKKVINENGKIELAKRLNKKLSNSQLDEQTIHRLPQNSAIPAERSKASRKKSTDEGKVQSKKVKCDENKSDNADADAIQQKPFTRLELKNIVNTRTEADSPVDSVSFVADQVVKEISINHSPTTKDMPGSLLEAGDASTPRLSSRSKERIREMTSKKKELKAKEEKRREKKKAKASEGLATVVNREPETTESLETVVDSVLDEEIPVIYKGEGNCNCPVNCCNTF